ncbi:peptidoglycan-binding domain-containing protein, partial [Candidatus Thalassarchaeum betae]|uniref:peptidoglycan-binding domain-containing protein n=1 Tax=Candidatus Thalassarchaeum betae TaxID=2599289 RepID=UPI0030C7558C|nr:peptidoglycan-binding protein [Candidatus Thalassoarchaea betae]
PWLNWVAIFDSNYESRWWGLLAILANYGALMPWIGSFLCAYWAFFRTPLWRRHEMSGWSFVVFFFGPFWLWLFFIGIPTNLWWGMMFGIIVGPEGEYLAWAWALFIPAIFLTLMGATPMLGGLYGFFIGFEDEPFPGEFGDRNLSSGMKGDDVTRLQEILNAAHEEKIGVDGSFGSQTEGAVKAFQGETGLTVDGIVGAITRAALQVIEIVETIDDEDTDEDIVQAETAFQKLISDMPFEVEQAIQKIWKRRLGLKIESLTVWWKK